MSDQKVVCPICDNFFIKPHHLSKYCSFSCKKEGEKKTKALHYKNNTELYKTRAKQNPKKNPKKYFKKRKEYREKNKEKISKKARKYREENKEKLRIKKQVYSKIYNSTPERKKYMKEYRKNNRKKERLGGKKYRNTEKGRRSQKNGHLKRKYNITLDYYEKLKQKQRNLCAICGCPETSLETKNGSNRVKDLAVDHCHKTNKVRGLLCFRCNTTIGKFEDNIELLENAINYLKNCKKNLTIVYFFDIIR